MMSTGGLSQTKWSPCKEFFLKNYFDCLNNTRVSCHRRINAGEWGALDNSARDQIIDRAIIAQKGGLKRGGKFELPFGATEVFPRLKVSVARWQNLIPFLFLDCNGLEGAIQGKEEIKFCSVA